MNMLKAREHLEVTQVEMAKKLGWTTARQVAKIEAGGHMTQQTSMAVECLLRRHRKLKSYMEDLSL